MAFFVRYAVMCFISLALAFGFAMATGRLALVFLPSDEEAIVTDPQTFAKYTIVGFASICLPLTLVVSFVLACMSNVSAYELFHVTLCISSTTATGFGAAMYKDGSAGPLLIGGAVWGLGLFLFAICGFMMCSAGVDAWKQYRASPIRPGDLETGTVSTPPRVYRTIVQPDESITLGVAK